MHSVCNAPLTFAVADLTFYIIKQLFWIEFSKVKVISHISENLAFYHMIERIVKIVVPCGPYKNYNDRHSYNRIWQDSLENPRLIHPVWNDKEHRAPYKRAEEDRSVKLKSLKRRNQRNKKFLDLFYKI